MIKIRTARPHEATVLTALAVASKSAWGYSPDFIASARFDLALTEEEIRNESFYVRTAFDSLSSDVVGVSALRRGQPEWGLHRLFVSPKRMREASVVCYGSTLSASLQRPDARASSFTAILTRQASTAAAGPISSERSRHPWTQLDVFQPSGFVLTQVGFSMRTISADVRLLSKTVRKISLTL